MRMEVINIGYLTVINMGGDPYNEKTMLRVIDNDSSISKKYKVKIDFKQKTMHDVLYNDITCPLCKKGNLVGSNENGFVCAICNITIRLVVR